MQYSDIIQRLKDKNYRITRQREAIVKVLVESTDVLLSAEDLLAKTKKVYPNTNLSTIYRNLEALSEFHLLYHVPSENGSSLYKVVCSDDHHHHIICQKCGRVQTIHFCPLDTLTNLAKDKGFVLTSHKIELYGYCDDCLQPSQ